MSDMSTKKGFCSIFGKPVCFFNGKPGASTLPNSHCGQDSSALIIRFSDPAKPQFRMVNRARGSVAFRQASRVGKRVNKKRHGKMMTI